MRQRKGGILSSLRAAEKHMRQVARVGEEGE